VGDLLISGELTKFGEMAGVYEDVWLCTGERKIPNPVVECFGDGQGFVSRILKAMASVILPVIDEHRP